MIQTITNEIKKGQTYKSRIDNRLFKITNIYTENGRVYAKVKNLQKQDRENDYTEIELKHFRYLLMDLYTNK